MSTEIRRTPLTEEDILDLYDRVKRISTVLEKVINELVYSDELSPELLDRIHNIYKENF